MIAKSHAPHLSRKYRRMSAKQYAAATTPKLTGGLGWWLFGLLAHGGYNAVGTTLRSPVPAPIAYDPHPAHAVAKGKSWLRRAMDKLRGK